MVGGIRITVYENTTKKGRDTPTSSVVAPAATVEPSASDDIIQLYEETVKFTALLGRSELEVSHRFIALPPISTVNQTMKGKMAFMCVGGI